MKNFFAAYRRPLALVLALVLMGGLLVYTRMQTSLFPEITFPKIKVIADNGLQPVDKMMVTVTQPLELAIKKIQNLQMIRSTTSRGSCEISAFLNWGANIDLGMQQINERISEIRSSLPPDVQITVEKMNPSILPVMGYALESNTLTPIELKLLALYTIRPYLAQVPGVSQIQIMGGRTKEYWVTLHPEKMTALHLTPAAVAQAISKTNFVLANGYVDDYHRLYLSVTNDNLVDLNQLQHIVITNDGKRVVYLQDIADVTVQEAIEYTRINANGHNAVLIGVIKQPNANLIEVSDQVEARVKSLQRLLPPGVKMVPYYIQADFVHDAIHSVTDALWIGILLAIIVAILFLRSWKASATLLVTVPITLALTLIVLYAVGYTFNIMTLGAIAAAIGLIIDDAIVVTEQIHRTGEEHPDVDTPTLVKKAIQYLFPAMVASSLSTIVIFIPFGFMSGVAGAYFQVLANTMIITLVCSFLVTWIGLPVIYLTFSRKHRRIQHAQKTVKTQRWVQFFLNHVWLSALFCILLAAMIFWILPRLGTGFLPDMDEGSIVLDYTSPPGTSLDETDRMCRQVEKIIMSTPEVESYSRRTGTQMGFFITEPNTGDYLISLKKNRKRTTDQVIDDIRKRIEASLPALRVDFGQVITDMLGDLTESTQPIEIKIFGNNPSILHQIADSVAYWAATVPGAADVFNGIVIAGPSVDVRPRADVLAQYGMTPADLQFQLQTQLQGTVVGQVLDQQQMTDVRMIYPHSRQRTVADIRNTEIFLPNGTLKPVGAFATISLQPGSAEIQRENLQTVDIVTARLNQRDLGSVMHDIQARIAGLVVLPQGYHIEYGGNYAQQQRSFRELLLILITAGLLVCCVTAFMTRNLWVSLSILLIAALGTAGCILALWITGTPLNVGSYTGIIMIVGIIGENAIFTFQQFHQRLNETKNVNEALVYAISTRLRPKLMTALGAIIALMPLALGIGVGAQLHQPLAIAVIGGFIMALPLLLIVLPSWLKLIYRHYSRA
ncbi:CzcA family heavy metal efflux pump [Thermoflavifilum aggregans]|uniref:CzcA family heavy metal efflux pump n=1 Tax=Thermoflavifilum aggregans TaxID=454188 RepID=A0A2M9CTT2_9BACT|nr:efflux RND transporter permease subunit [Thermoflavifilum aggregans]PJJ75332.1 CzcA family heavy metal efflux pump [Thermoflavifilum aggregans]